LGNNSLSNSLTPTQVGSDLDWSSISAGESHTCAIRTNGSTWCWGSNAYTQIGDGTFTQRQSPVIVQAARSPGEIPLTESQILDTRTSTGKIGAINGGGNPFVFNVLGLGGLPQSGVRAIKIRMTLTDTETSGVGGYIQAYACLGNSPPNDADAYFYGNQSVSTTVIAPIDANGNLCLNAYGKANIIIAVLSYFQDDFQSVEHRRLLDSRSSGRVGTNDNQVSTLRYTLPYSVVSQWFQIGLPVRSIVLTLSVVDTLSSASEGYLKAYTCDGGAQMGTSRLPPL
jgi:hypothetical protein